VTAFVFALVLAVALTGAIAWWGLRHPPNMNLTWGEAFVAALVVFGWMIVIFGVLPNQWLQWSDGPLRWRSDKIGIPAGPLGWPLTNGNKYLGFIPFDKGTFWPHGITFFGRGRITFTAQDLRDIVAALIYVVALVGLIIGWLAWQARGKAKPATPELPSSAYGRPLVRNV